MLWYPFRAALWSYFATSMRSHARNQRRSTQVGLGERDNERIGGNFIYIICARVRGRECVFENAWGV